MSKGLEKSQDENRTTACFKDNAEEMVVKEI